MADTLGDPFHSFSSSTTSFRISPGSELQGHLRPVSAPSLTESQEWDQPSTYSHTSGPSATGESEYEDLKRSRSSPIRKSSYATSTVSTPRAPSIKAASSVVLPPATTAVRPPKMKRQPQRVLRREVWRDMLLRSDGRDKAFVSSQRQLAKNLVLDDPNKLIQYSIRVYLWFHLKTFPRFGTEFDKRLRSTMSGFSLVRKCMLLFNWLTPFIQITNPPPVPYSSTGDFSDSISPARRPKPSLLHRLLHASPPTLIDLFNSVADDIYTFYRLGLVPSSVGHKADRVANWLWWLSTLAGLIEVETDAAAVKALMQELDNRIYDVELDPKTLGRSSTKSNKRNSALIPTGQPNNIDLSVGVEEATEGLEKLKRQSWTLRITRWKLCMDLIFVCAYPNTSGMCLGR
ncbi:hypothetical protein FRB99_006182 [Tulasnella sp. 403]|nr:hypothetical protein FRB99_006182 [Tulasnella sp. 403]